jgi:hypothetical protein
MVGAYNEWLARTMNFRATFRRGMIDEYPFHDAKRRIGLP